MNVDYQQIATQGGKADYVVEVDGGDVVITEDRDTGRSAALSNARTAVPDAVDLPDESAVSASGDVRYAVTTDGDFVSYDPESAEGVPPLRCHVGHYESETDTLTLLEFVSGS